MSRFHNLRLAAALSVTATTALASPTVLITHNTTDLESNAFIDGTIPSNYPSRPHSDNRVSWVAVKMASFGHSW